MQGIAPSLTENAGLVLLAFALVLLNGFFVAAEFAIVKIRSTRVESLAKLHGWSGRALSAIHRRLDAYLSACQLGITLASLGLGWIGEPAFARLLEAPAAWLGLDHGLHAVSVSFIFAFTTIAFLHIVVGELAPKSMAIRMPERVSLWSAIPLWTFFWMMYPFIWVLNASANRFLRWAGLGMSTDVHESPYTREELRSILHLSRPASDGRVVSSMVSHALDLPDLHVRDLMRPAAELVAIEPGSTYEEVRELVRAHRLSRYPIFDADNNVRGIVHVKDIMFVPDGPDYFDRLVGSMQEPHAVSEEASISQLLKRFQEGATHFAIVSYADGRVAGFLTMEDVLEAIFGEIRDEHERAHEGQRRREPQWQGETLLAGGDTPLFRVERELNRAIEDSDHIGTIAGLLMTKLDRMPRVGDVVRHDLLQFEVLDVVGTRLKRVRIRGSDPHLPLVRATG
jgi:CBS domain containing-hemolysin-like protein